MTPELAEFCGGHRLICGSDDDAGGGPVCQGRDGSGADAIRVTFWCSSHCAAGFGRAPPLNEGANGRCGDS